MSEPSTPLTNSGSFSQHSSPNKKVQYNKKLLILKLKRINELNNRLKDTLSKDRIYASNASYSIIDYTQSHKDYAIPEIWGIYNQVKIHLEIIGSNKRLVVVVKIKEDVVR